MAGTLCYGDVWNEGTYDPNDWKTVDSKCTAAERSVQKAVTFWQNLRQIALSTAEMLRKLPDSAPLSEELTTRSAWAELCTSTEAQMEAHLNFATRIQHSALQPGNDLLKHVQVKHGQLAKDAKASRTKFELAHDFWLKRKGTLAAAVKEHQKSFETKESYHGTLQENVQKIGELNSAFFRYENEY
jgi:hypothetical protein